LKEVEPRVTGTPAVGSATSQDARRDRADVGVEVREGPRHGHGDRAILSSAARARLRDDPEGSEVGDAIALARHVASSAQEHVTVAGAAHTAAVVRAARLIR